MAKIKECRRCELYKTRRNIVCGEGKIDADVKFIGEAPGRSEDLTGRPFIGKSGTLLRGAIMRIAKGRWILQEIYISNVVLCRPPDNRNPTKEEIKACSKWLRYDLIIQRPKIVVCVGKVAAEALIGEQNVDWEWNGVYRKRKALYIPIYHPSYVMRTAENSNERRMFISGIKKALRKGGLI